MDQKKEKNKNTKTGDQIKKFFYDKTCGSPLFLDKKQGEEKMTNGSKNLFTSGPGGCGR